MKPEDYVSYEVADILKDMGYNEYCDGYYHSFEEIADDDERNMLGNDSFEWGDGFLNSENRYRIGAPSLYEAQKWLREKYDILVTSNCQRRNEWVFTIWRITDEDCDFAQPLEVEDRIDGKSYESALNAGILEALKLIDE